MPLPDSSGARVRDGYSISSMCDLVQMIFPPGRELGHPRHNRFPRQPGLRRASSLPTPVATGPTSSGRPSSFAHGSSSFVPAVEFVCASRRVRLRAAVEFVCARVEFVCAGCRVRLCSDRVRLYSGRVRLRTGRVRLCQPSSSFAHGPSSFVPDFGDGPCRYFRRNRYNPTSCFGPHNLPGAGRRKLTRPSFNIGKCGQSDRGISFLVRRGCRKDRARRRIRFDRC